MDRTPDFFEDLRRVGALKKGLLGGRPTDNTLSKIPRPQVSRDTVGAWLRGKRFPQRLEPVWAVLQEIRAESARQGVLDRPADGISGESVADLLAEDRLRRAWAAEQERRTQANQEGLERRQSRSALEDEERRARQAALADRPRPVRSWTPQRLGVHRAIPGRPATQDGADFVLPTYVARPHDDRLHARLAAAVTDSESLLVVVRGESCTGKTRTAVEALAAMPDDFQLLFPSDADSLLSILAADALGPRSVLWLNEAQHYLHGPAGEAAAAALLRRLDGDGPFIALATLWPDHDKTLTTTPALGKEQDDPHRQARALLAQAHYIHLPPSFADHLDAVRRAAGRDASLATALESGGSDVTQVLAAGPDLVAHYEHPCGPHGVYGKALLSAAMDAHRLGVTGPLPLAFLHHAAPGYVTGSERAAADADTWFTDALTHAQGLIKQTIRPLQDVPRPSGMGALPGVVGLADYLQQHGRRIRRLLCPPATFWNAATHHLTSPDDLTHLAKAAGKRHRLRHAAHLYCAAADAGDTDALVRLARMRQGAGDQEEAERLCRVAADAGNTNGLLRLAEMREKAGDQRGAERLARQAADAGDPYTLVWLAKLREKTEDQGGAERLARQAVDAGHKYALVYLVEMREKADQEGAERLARQAADAGDEYALLRLAEMREKAGDQRGAERLARQAADAGNTNALLRLARLREGAGDQEGAERLALQAADAGDEYALLRLAEMREKAGDQRGAERLALQGADAGDEYALLRLAEMREEAGDQEGAERLARQAADAGNQYALMRLALTRERARDQEGAERLARQAADAGDKHTLALLAEMRAETGDKQGAERLYRAAADAGNTSALALLAEMREEAGDREGAERLARQATDAGHPHALPVLADMRAETGDKQGAERLYRAAADAGNTSALALLAKMREEAGDREGAERLYRAAADAGNFGDEFNVMRVRWPYGLEADGAASGQWEQPEPRMAANGSG